MTRQDSTHPGFARPLPPVSMQPTAMVAAQPGRPVSRRGVDWAKLRNALGLPPSATIGEVQAAAVAYAETEQATSRTAALISAPTIPADVLLHSAVYGTAAEQVVDGAILEGKVHPSRREKLLEEYSRDSVGVEQQIAQLMAIPELAPTLRADGQLITEVEATYLALYPESDV